MKSEIRDAALSARQKVVSDEEFINFIKDIMNETPTVARVNFLKDFIWRENIPLDGLKSVVLDSALLSSIIERYSRDRASGALGKRALFLNMGMSKEDSIRWAYEIKVKKKTYEQLVQEENLRESFITMMAQRIAGGPSQ